MFHFILGMSNQQLLTCVFDMNMVQSIQLRRKVLMAQIVFMTAQVEKLQEEGQNLVQVFQYRRLQIIGLTSHEKIKHDEEILDDESIMSLNDIRDGMKVRRKLKEFLSYQNKLQKQQTYRDAHKNLSVPQIDQIDPAHKHPSSIDIRKLSPEFLQAVVDRDYLESKEKIQKNRKSFIVSNEYSMFPYHKKSNPLLKNKINDVKFTSTKSPFQQRMALNTSRAGTTENSKLIPYKKGHLSRSTQKRNQIKVIEKKLGVSPQKSENKVITIFKKCNGSNIQKLSKIIYECQTERKDNDTLYQTMDEWGTQFQIFCQQKQQGVDGQNNTHRNYNDDSSILQQL
ncbi:UNKNOWN [Stylonychia lemnae]|uniref:Uncharacterized protein n=1 Tax=Stylonychia lemnae TaxID=5949 RepID=A0A078ABZ9_STYLE|nr:UNKNOWN [Stylonychia lemnae]|eukprot:CDW79127.1 UNKNOWN [Stylonychia lemnae]